VNRRWAAYGLFALAALMLWGFARSSLSIGSPSAIGALLVAVVLPAVSGIVLFRGIGSGDRARHTRLRQQTIEAEVLKLAIQQQGKLTAVEVATALALPEDETKVALDAMVEREVADIQITDEGVIVYTFESARQLGTKHTSRDILDA
jgi:apolipoprotein N-acyltransferase